MSGVISQLSPDEISSILLRRLSPTNDLYFRRNIDDIEQEKVIFFKYYFDFSSAIEYCLRGIVFEYSKKPLVGGCIDVFAQPASTLKPYFLRVEEFVAIVNEKEILEGTNNTDFLLLVKKYLKNMEPNLSNCSFDDFEITKEKYKQIRKVRNTIAHGLSALEANIEYSQTQLFDFVSKNH